MIRRSEKMKRFIQRGISLILSLLLVSAAIPAASAAHDDQKAKRTVLFYCCGSDLETESGLASFNLKQVLSANFSADDDVRFIVMTGGSLLWNMESSYLCDPHGVGISTDPETGEYTISNEYNQIWEAMGADAKENAGKLVLLDADGVTATAILFSYLEKGTCIGYGGLVHINYQTQKRTLKDSAYWYKEVIASNGANL